jgi:hypothetical protein
MLAPIPHVWDMDFFSVFFSPKRRGFSGRFSRKFVLRSAFQRDITISHSLSLLVHEEKMLIFLHVVNPLQVLEAQETQEYGGTGDTEHYFIDSRIKNIVFLFSPSETIRKKHGIFFLTSSRSSIEEGYEHEVGGGK